MAYGSSIIKYMRIKFYVIDKINGENYYDDLGYEAKQYGRKIVVIPDDIDKIEKMDMKLWRGVKQECFRLGEIIIVDDESGREIEWPWGGRAPRKWDVEWREFDDIQKAVRYSKKVSPKD